MGFLKATQLEDYKEETIKEEILTLAKELVELRLKKAERDDFGLKKEEKGKKEYLFG